MAHLIVLWQIQKFIFALFYFVFEGNFQVQAPGAYIRRGDLTEGFLRYEFGGLIFYRMYFRLFFVLNKVWVLNLQRLT